MSEINPNEEVTVVVEDAEVITTPIDATLTISGDAADAKAVGDALALKADASAINTIKVNEQSADNQGQILLTGEDVPLNDDEDAPTIAEAVAAEQGKTAPPSPFSRFVYYVGYYPTKVHFLAPKTQKIIPKPHFFPFFLAQFRKKQ